MSRERIRENVDSAAGSVRREELEARAERVLERAGVTREQVLDFEDLGRLEGVPGVTVYLTGSLVEEGLGNAGSDVDVVVVADADAPYTLTRNYTATGHFVGRRRIEYAYWKPATVTALARRLDPPPDRPLDFRLLDEEEVNFIHRIKVGAPLLNLDAFAEIQGQFDLERFRRYMTEDSIDLMGSILEDVWGMIDDRDFDSALLRVRDLLDEMYAAYCAHLGETNPNRKWRLKVFERLAGHPRTPAMIERFWTLGFPDARALRADPAQAEAYLRRCIAAVNETAEWIQQ